MDEEYEGTLTQVCGYPKPEHEFIRKARDAGSHSRPLSAGRSSPQELILDEFCATCGYHRKSALRLLHRPLAVPGTRARPGLKPTYDPEVLLPVLKRVWLASDQLCSKLLKAALPEWLEHYEGQHAPLTWEVKEKLLAISPAQIDRLLRSTTGSIWNGALFRPDKRPDGKMESGLTSSSVYRNVVMKYAKEVGISVEGFGPQLSFQSKKPSSHTPRQVSLALKEAFPRPFYHQ